MKRYRLYKDVIVFYGVEINMVINLLVNIYEHI